MNRYAFINSYAEDMAARSFKPEVDVAEIASEVAAAEAWYEDLVRADRAQDEIYAVLENLQTLSKTLVDCFYSNESIEAMNLDKSLTKLTGYATESITPQIAEEAIKEGIAKAWEALKNFISKIIDTIGNFFAKLFNMASAQAQKIVDTKGAEIDFAAEKETLTSDQCKNLRMACEMLNSYVEKHIEIKNYVVGSSVAVAGASSMDNVVAEINKQLGDIVTKSGNILKAEDGKVTIVDEALKREKQVLSTAGWTATGAVELAKYFLENKNKATRLGTLMKRLKAINVDVNMIGPNFTAAKTACRAETSAYACYAKCLRAFGKQVKCLNGSHKKASETTGKK